MDDEPDVSTGNHGGNDPNLPNTTPPVTGGPTTTPSNPGGDGSGKASTLPFDDNTKKMLAGAIINGYDSSGWGKGSARISNIDLIYGSGAGRQV